MSKYELKEKNYEKEFKYLLKGHKNYIYVRKLFFEKGIKYQLDELPKITELEKLKSTAIEHMWLSELEELKTQMAIPSAIKIKKKTKK